MKKTKPPPSRECSRNFILSRDIDRKLDLLARDRDMSRSQVIRALVTIEFEKAASLALSLPKSNRS